MPTFSVGSNIDTGIAAHRVDTDLVLLADVDLSDRTLVCVDTASPVVSQVIACLSTRAPVTTHGVSTAVSTTSIILTTFILICHTFIDTLFSLKMSKVWREINEMMGTITQEDNSRLPLKRLRFQTSRP